MKSFGEHRKECICYEGAFVLGIFVIFSDRKLTSPFIRPYAANPAVSFRTASACLCGCFFAVVSPGDGCAYVGGYQPTAILQLSVELVRITGVCGPFICSAGSIFSPGPRLRENYLWKKMWICTVSTLSHSHFFQLEVCGSPKRHVWETILCLLKSLTKDNSILGGGKCLFSKPMDPI